MRRRQLRPYTGTGDTMGLAVCLAIVAHALLIFGINFAADDDKKTQYDTLDVMLVQKSSKNSPEKADFLAQQNLEGGGESDEVARPATPFISPSPEQAPNLVTPSAMSVPSPPTDAVNAEQALTADRQTSKNEEEAEDEEKAKADELLAAEVEKSKNALTTPEAKHSPEGNEGEDAEEASKPQPESPSAAELMSRSMEMASLSAEIDRRLEAKAKRPKRKFISASTREYKYAAYMESWRAKVERFGNLNYPEVARKANRSFSVTIDVALNANGTINEIVIRKSSGNKDLDKAAMQIVRMGAPYAVFPEDIREEIDVLHITRTWKFKKSQGLSGR